MPPKPEAVAVPLAPSISSLMARARHTGVRWQCLLHLNVARPDFLTDEALRESVRNVYPDISLHELRREVDYLAEQLLLTIVVKRGFWHLKLSWRGADIVEYTSECPVGIGRPAVPE